MKKQIKLYKDVENGMLKGERNLGIYLIKTEDKINKEAILRIALVVLIIIMLILLIFVANYSINIIRNSKIAKQYEEQIALLEKQELELEKTQWQEFNYSKQKAKEALKELNKYNTNMYN